MGFHQRNDADRPSWPAGMAMAVAFCMLLYVSTNSLSFQPHFLLFPGEPTTATWMKDNMQILQSRSLLDITLPGTHDAAAYELSETMSPGQDERLEQLVEFAEKIGIPVYPFIIEWGLAQSQTLYQQLVLGARWLDVRAIWDEETSAWRTVHFLLGNPIEMLLQDVNAFLDAHPQEVIVVDLSAFGNSPADKRHDLAKMVNTIFGTKLWPVAQSLNSTLGEVVGKGYQVLVTFEDQSVQSAYPYLWPRSIYEGDYSNKDRLEEMMMHNTGLVETLGGKGKLFRVWWTLTPQVDTIIKSVRPRAEFKSLFDLGREANSAIVDYSKQMVNYQLGNLFIVDFIEHSLAAQTVIDYNLRNCFDNPSYRARSGTGDDCRSWNEAGRCEADNADDVAFMQQFCPLSCGLC
eukprot:TRINITY_DN15055_c0_g1::TRINITY_DN15055_c0_g1_i1::g.25021::m.25021 TRINITY_DN15055_c0_g1::TRINITY_DN15055_c0_g1_i1::g.25021  ORF type:complete len:445 (+),score=30.74,sp/B2RXA1/PLCX2_MOUSE/27.16/2e-21,ShK/PF01549.19/6.2e-06,Varsurf_PPLC/PF03490.8/0.16 TRINITY_DN15055_c0_g1_i1:124-1335(+)